ncbi:MAG TPA: hypothetical protein VMT46_15965 [Anaerolineaceae bacterium]|nr:hypothetical protein [Anaerolineaceae bacterium]
MFIAGLLLVVFLASDVAGTPSLSYLCGGVTLLLLGFAFWKSAYTPPSPSGRFRILRGRPKDKK